jgi:hypothetical protein
MWHIVLVGMSAAWGEAEGGVEEEEAEEEEEDDAAASLRTL